MATVQDLKEFIDYAEKNRKYAKNTAQGRRAALKMFEDELNEDEANSVELLGQRFDKIYASTYQKNRTKMTASSWETYKKRMHGLLKDFGQYGTDPSRFNAWDSTRKVEPKTKSKPGRPQVIFEAEVVNGPDFVDESAVRNFIEADRALLFNSDLNKLEVFIRPGFKVSLILPIDMKQSEADRLKHMIDGMVGVE